jgi:hypothetical protein
MECAVIRMRPQITASVTSQNLSLLKDPDPKLFSLSRTMVMSQWRIQGIFKGSVPRSSSVFKGGSTVILGFQRGFHAQNELFFTLFWQMCLTKGRMGFRPRTPLWIRQCVSI